MKRSHRIVLVLLGGASTGVWSGCSRPPPVVRISPESVYANNTFVPGAGYYHAPFHAFFAVPYNHFNPTTRQYFFGGQWGAAPYQSPINLSSPTFSAAQLAEAMRTDVTRGGFGGYFSSGS